MADPTAAVIGGGPAGCSAGVFLARYGLDVTIFDRGNASIQQCAFLENYLGFPGGIDVETFRALATAHAERVGCALVRERVERVAATSEGFDVWTDGDAVVSADYVVAATALDGDYLTGLGDGVLTMESDGDESDEGESDGDESDGDEPDEAAFDPAVVDVDGRTPVDGLYVAGPLAGAPSQVVIAAGDGARAARALLTDHRRHVDGLWEEAAAATDWVVRQGRHEGDDWVESTVAYYADRAPDDLDDEVVRTRARELVAAFQDWQITADEAERRRQRAHRRLAEHVDAEALAAAVDPADVVAEHGVEAVRAALEEVSANGEAGSSGDRTRMSGEGRR